MVLVPNKMVGSLAVSHTTPYWLGVVAPRSSRFPLPVAVVVPMPVTAWVVSEGSARWKRTLLPSVVAETLLPGLPAASLMPEISNRTVPFGSMSIRVYVALHRTGPPETVAALPAMVTLGALISSEAVKDSVIVSPTLALVGSLLSDWM